MVRKSVLSNGVRVLTEPMPQVLSATIGIWVENGSRYEQSSAKMASRISSSICCSRARRNAPPLKLPSKSTPSAACSTPSPARNTPAITPRSSVRTWRWRPTLLADLFLESIFDPDEIDRERQVVLQEISQAEDTPDDFIHDLFNLHFWEGHPLALPIFGSDRHRQRDRSRIAGLFHGRPLSRRARLYRGGRRVDHDKLVADCERLFGGVAGDDRKPNPISPPTDTRGGAESSQGTRAGSSVSGRPEHQPGRSAALCRLCDEHSAGRRHVVAAVSGSARKARPRLQHLFVPFRPFSIAATLASMRGPIPNGSTR